MNHADIDDCPLCGGCGEVTIVPHGGADGDADSYGCPMCIQAERDAEIEELRAQNAALVAALERMLAMHDTMMTKVNHGASFFDADCLREMNEAPSQAAQAIASAKGGAQ